MVGVDSDGIRGKSINEFLVTGELGHPSMMFWALVRWVASGSRLLAPIQS